MIIKIIIKKNIEKKLLIILLFFCQQIIHTENVLAPVAQKKLAKSTPLPDTDCEDHEEDEIEEFPPFTIPPFDFTIHSLETLELENSLNDLEAEIISQELEEVEVTQEETITEQEKPPQNTEVVL